MLCFVIKFTWISSTVGISENSRSTDHVVFEATDISSKVGPYESALFGLSKAIDQIALISWRGVKIADAASNKFPIKDPNFLSGGCISSTFISSLP